MAAVRKKRGKIPFDVCLSFAGENRTYVDKVAAQLRSRGLRIFYDRYEEVALWGKNLYEHLDDVYRNAARYCVLFISAQYAKKLWTNHERRSAQARAFRENYEYILPARFDKTGLPGLLPTVGYVDLRGLSAKQFADLVVKKVGLRNREYYVPPEPDRLYDRLGVTDPIERQYVLQHAEEFTEALRRMTELEKKILASIFIYGCPADLPKNMHISADLLRRILNLPASRCLRELQRLDSLGFTTTISRRKADPAIKLSFHCRGIGYDGPDDETGTVDSMIGCLTDDYCHACALKAILKGDFSALASITRKPERHVKGARQKVARTPQ